MFGVDGRSIDVRRQEFQYRSHRLAMMRHRSPYHLLLVFVFVQTLELDSAVGLQQHVAVAPCQWIHRWDEPHAGVSLLDVVAEFHIDVTLSTFDAVARLFAEMIDAAKQWQGVALTLCQQKTGHSREDAQ